jgi:hypothetical protein
VHLRRALLLFAIVLGLAALATSISRTPSERSGDEAGPPTSTPPAQTTPAAAPLDNNPGERTIVFDAGVEKPVKRTLEVDRNATVFVKTEEDGLVDVDGLGLTEPAEPGTPATFEVLESKPGSYVIYFTPSAGEEAERVGVLEIVAG